MQFDWHGAILFFPSALNIAQMIIQFIILAKLSDFRMGIENVVDVIFFLNRFVNPTIIIEILILLTSYLTPYQILIHLFAIVIFILNSRPSTREMFPSRTFIRDRKRYNIRHGTLCGACLICFAWSFVLMLIQFTCPSKNLLKF